MNVLLIVVKVMIIALQATLVGEVVKNLVICFGQIMHGKLEEKVVQRLTLSVVFLTASFVWRMWV